MLRKFIVLSCLILASCASDTSQPTHDHRFTIPFSRNVDLTIWEPQEHSVQLHSAVPRELLAPGNVQVMDVWHGEVVLTDVSGKGVMVMDGIDYLDVSEGEELCGGEHMGHSQQVRIRAYWGDYELAEDPDLSLVRIVRNSIVTDLADVRVMDQVHSALVLPGERESFNDINRGECPYGGE